MQHKENEIVGLGSGTVGLTNGGTEAVGFEEPYVATATLEGTAPLLFHAWNVESVEEKANSAKGSKAKKTDNVESYVRRNSKKEICIPGTYVRGTLVNAARFLQDPRSPRKSAMDLFKAGIAPTEELFSLGKKTWDYLDRQHVVVQRSGITRVRPALLAGWRVDIGILCLVPEYISPQLVHEALIRAGRLVGLGDFRPTYGRFQVVKFEVKHELA